MLITTDQLRKIATTLSAVKSQEMTDLINDLCVKYGCTSTLSFRMFLANVIQESGEFGLKSENMNYRTADRIKAVWPGRFPTIESATPFVKYPQALANKAYGGRMGNTAPNDGWLYRGAGFIGITGKELYSKYAAYIKLPVEQAAELMRTTDQYALDSALWFFCVYKKLIPVAETGNFKGVCSFINTGSIKKPAIGMDVRQKYFDRINEVLK